MTKARKVLNLLLFKETNHKHRTVLIFPTNKINKTCKVNYFTM